MNLSNELVAFNLDENAQTELMSNFNEFIGKVDNWTKINETLVITDASQVTEMKLARTVRLELKDFRVAIEKKRKSLKEDSLNYGRAVDLIAKKITETIVPLEQELTQKEKFAELQDLKRREDRKVIREARLRQLDFEHNLNYLDLLNITDEVFEEEITKAKLLADFKRKEAEEKEKERLAQIEEEKRKQEELRLENERLKKEAERMAKIAEQKSKLADFLDNLNMKYTLIIEKFPGENCFYFGFKDGNDILFNRKISSIIHLEEEIDKALYIDKVLPKEVI